MRHYSDTHQNAAQCDKTILELRQRGLSYRAIGKHVHMSANGVMCALRPWRPAAGGPDPYSDDHRLKPQLSDSLL